MRDDRIERDIAARYRPDGCIDGRLRGRRAEYDGVRWRRGILGCLDNSTDRERPLGHSKNNGLYDKATAPGLTDDGGDGTGASALGEQDGFDSYIATLTPHQHSGEVKETRLESEKDGVYYVIRTCDGEGDCIDITCVYGLRQDDGVSREGGDTSTGHP